LQALTIADDETNKLQ